MIMLDAFYVIVGAAVLMIAADRLVTSSGVLASRLGISPIIVGAVVIGFGSSLPEMLVSLASLDQPNGLDLAMGNVIGSNIANIGLVLGFSVVFFPFSGTAALVRREGTLMLGGLLLMSLFVWDGALQRWEGAVLVAALTVCGFVVVSWSRSGNVVESHDDGLSTSMVRLWVGAVIALISLAIGARVLVLGAEGLAVELGLSEGLVGLTILALGTSLPELGTVVASARRKRNDLVLGNVVGSNLFNALGVAGVSGIVGAGTLATSFRADLVVMIAIAVFAGVAAFSGDRYHRVEGALMLLAYPAAIWVLL